MAFFDSLLGTEGRYKLQPTMPQQNLDALQNLLKLGQQNIQNPYQGFEPIKQAAMSNFLQQIVPALTERFAASGQNAPSSGTLQQGLSQAGSSLAEKLASLQSDYGQRQQQLGLQQVGLGLTPGHESIYEPGEQGLLSQLLPLALDAAAAYFTGGASIPLSAAKYAGQASQAGQAQQPRQSLQGGINAYNALSRSPINSLHQQLLKNIGAPSQSQNASQASNLLNSQSGLQNLLGQSTLSGLNLQSLPF